ncbi:MAG TPA: alpha/beta hydrolase [Pseudonocardiaceae bacterium]|nr:alpha/beta hydrolase [Pseudonocardiaceae bacterium]
MTTTRGGGRPALAGAPWDPSAAHRFVTGDRTPLYVDDSGPAGDPEAPGPTLILLHGWTLDHTEWDEVLAALPGSPHALRTIRYDHRGHGGSGPAPKGTATVEQAADDLAELIAERVPAGPIVLVGHSMGGMTIMALVERHPHLLPRIAGAAFVATSSGGLDKLNYGLPRWLALRVANTERRLNRRLAGLDRTALLNRPGVARPGLRWLVFGRKPDRRAVVHTAAQVGRCHPASMVGFRASMGTHQRRAALAALRDTPTVVLAGGADRLLPVSHARVIAEELGTELLIYPDAGHMLNVERAEQVTDRIARLLVGASAPRHS